METGNENDQAEELVLPVTEACLMVIDKLSAQISAARMQTPKDMGEYIEDLTSLMGMFKLVAQRIDEWASHVDTQNSNIRNRGEEAISFGSEFQKKTNTHATESLRLLKRSSQGASDAQENNSVINDLAVQLYNQSVAEKPDVKVLRALSLKLILRAISTQQLAQNVVDDLAIVCGNLESCFEQINTTYVVHQKFLHQQSALTSNARETMERHVKPELDSINTCINKGVASLKFQGELQRLVNFVSLSMDDFKTEISHPGSQLASSGDKLIDVNNLIKKIEDNYRLNIANRDGGNTV